MSGRGEHAGHGSSLAPLVVVLLGLLSTALLLAIHGISERHVGRSVPLTLAAADFRTEISQAHLWLEEHISGDRSIDLESAVWVPLSRAERIACASFGACLDDDQPAPPPEELLLPDDDRRRLAELLAGFEATARERVELSEGTQAGAMLDQSFDAFYEQIMHLAGQVRSRTHARMTAQQRRARAFLAGLLGAWVILVGIAVSAITRRERHRREAERERRRYDERLRQAEAERQRSQRLEAIGRLAGGFAHDVNNYLGAIAIQCELARQARGDPRAVDREVGEALETVQRAAALIQQLLAFSRRQPAAPRVVDVNTMVGGMRTMLGSLLGERVRLVTALDRGLWPVHADPAQMEQVVLNLVVNARDAMPRGGTVRIRTCNAPADPAVGQPADEVVLAVADEGCGIPPEVQERIYEPFFTTKRGGKASGLGLSTVFGIVKGAGGRIEFDTAPGVGTTFRIHLPRHVSQEHAARRETAPQAARGPVSRSLRVLLLENHPPLRRALEQMLETMGHEVTSTADGAQGLGVFARDQARWDLVISDVVMPVCSGREVARIVWSRRPRLPVLFISGYTDRVGVERLVEDHPARFLRKPFTARDLEDAIGALTGGIPGSPMEDPGIPRTA